jgi:hypothetical protein
LYVPVLAVSFVVGLLRGELVGQMITNRDIALSDGLTVKSQASGNDGVILGRWIEDRKPKYVNPMTCRGPERT